MGQGGFQSLSFVPADGIVYEEFGVLGRRGLRGNGSHCVLGQSPGLIGGETGFRLGQVRYGRLYQLFHFGAGEAGFRLWHDRNRRTYGRFHIGSSQTGFWLRHSCHGRLNGRFHLGLGETGLRSGHPRYGGLDSLFRLGAGQAGLGRRRSGNGHVRAHNLLHFLAGQPRGGVRIVIAACGQQDGDQQEQSRQRQNLELQVKHWASAFSLQHWFP